MPNSVRHSRSLMTLLALCLLPVGAFTGMATAGPTQPSKLCEIKVTPRAGLVSLEALVRADKATGGSYTLRIDKTGGGGSSSITQGGDFEVSAGKATTLGSVTLDSRGSYKAVLDVISGGKSYRCTKQVRDD